MPKKKMVPIGEAAKNVVILLPGESDVDAHLVDQPVQDLNRLYLAKGLETARVVGEYLVEHFFGGNAENFDRAHKDHQSFAALAEREDLKFGKSMLWYSVRLLPQLKALPEAVAIALPMSHHRLLLHVGDAKLKERLAKVAVDKGLSKRDFELEVKKARRKSGKASKAGRKAQPAFQKTIGRLGKILGKADDLFADLDAVEALDQGVALSLYQTLTGMKLKCEELQKALQGRAGM